MTNNINPFNITKAVDYSDVEIDKYWVDMPGQNGFTELMKPDSPMPMMILGGKGSGKTHIMRYFSYNLQKIRYGSKLIESIIEKKYIGVFLRCGGLNSSKFEGESQTDTAWKNIFSYYFELWIAQLIINVLEDIFRVSIDENSKYELIVCEKIKMLFDKDVSKEFNSFSEFRGFLQKLQKDIDYEVNNCAITGEKISESRILVSPGGLVFGLPKILTEQISYLRDIQFIYLIDEYENLLEYQQKYINTLIRERESPVSFRVGARWYGIKTYKTFSGDEELKIGSEYEKIIIDELLRSRSDNYHEFAKKICISRLVQAGAINNLNQGADVDIKSFFKESDLEEFYKKLRNKAGKYYKPYFVSLREKLKPKVIESEIDDIISNLTYDEDLLIERTNLFLFYRLWNRGGGKNLSAISIDVKSSCTHYVNDKSNKTSQHSKILEKFKGDLIDQLYRENREKLPYTGIEKIIRMSAGIPRHLLIMLKHIYRWSIYNGEGPFKNSVISEDAQLSGIDDAIKWFLDDARVPGPFGKPVAGTIERIGQIMHTIRFSDIPPECSMASFSINASENEGIASILEHLEQYSYLIKGPERREKNTSVQRDTYKINPLLAPKWELPISSRGILELTKKEVSAIFNYTADDEFNIVKKERRVKYNAPFKSEDDSALTLFKSKDE